MLRLGQLEIGLAVLRRRRYRAIVLAFHIRDLFLGKHRAYFLELLGHLLSIALFNFRVRQ